jgi:glycosyltransferase involved in cell wall biosynthesis
MRAALRPRVSVVIPVRDRAAWLAEAVNSVLATRVEPLEILVIDDGSIDGSFDLACSLAAGNSAVRLLTHPGRANRGQGPSRNLGIREAASGLVCFLDSDDIVLPHRFDVALPLLEASCEVDGVYEPTITHFLPGGEARRGTVRPIVSFECAHPDQVLETLVGRGRHWSVDAIVVRRDTLLRVGGFSVDVRLRAFEDLVLWLKLAAAARLVPGASEPVAVYRLHAANSSSADSQTQLLMPLRAYREAVRWAKRARVARRQQAILREALAAKLFFCCGKLRGVARPDLALRQILETLPAMPSLVTRRLFWGNLAYSGGACIRRHGSAPE